MDTAQQYKQLSRTFLWDRGMFHGTPDKQQQKTISVNINRLRLLGKASDYKKQENATTPQKQKKKSQRHISDSFFISNDDVSGNLIIP